MLEFIFRLQRIQCNVFGKVLRERIRVKSLKNKLKREDKADIEFNVEKDIVACSESEPTVTEEVMKVVNIT